MAEYKINDPIHGIIPFNEKEKTVIDHPYVQRLRHIRQLAFVSLVFPGAVHDRFSHSLGAMHTASLLGRQFLYNGTYSVLARLLSEKEKHFVFQIMRLAALLHDVGHAPFSHAAEDTMPPLHTLAIPLGWMLKEKSRRRAKHEDYTVSIVWALSQGDNAVLTDKEAEIIASLVHKQVAIPASWNAVFSSEINTQSLHALVRSWISGDIDVDRMDYLLRDSYFTGAPYGNYDSAWLINNLGVIEKKDTYVTSISEAGVHAFEYYLLARYNMFTQVYFHKTVRCFEHYFKQALHLKEITYPIPSNLYEYINLRDSTLTETMLHYAHAYPYSWSARLIGRNPSKRIIRIWGKKKATEDLFMKIRRETEKEDVHPFLAWSQSRFLDYEGTGALSMTPLFVVRKQFGMRTAANIEDSSFILKHYHQDITIGDIFIPFEEYGKKKEYIAKILKKHFIPSPSEIILEEEL